MGPWPPSRPFSRQQAAVFTIILLIDDLPSHPPESSLSRLGKNPTVSCGCGATHDDDVGDHTQDNGRAIINRLPALLFKALCEHRGRHRGEGGAKDGNDRPNRHAVIDGIEPPMDVSSRAHMSYALVNRRGGSGSKSRRAHRFLPNDAGMSLSEQMCAMR